MSGWTTAMGRSNTSFPSSPPTTISPCDNASSKSTQTAECLESQFDFVLGQSKPKRPLSTLAASFQRQSRSKSVVIVREPPRERLVRRPLTAEENTLPLVRARQKLGGESLSSFQSKTGKSPTVEAYVDLFRFYTYDNVPLAKPVHRRSLKSKSILVKKTSMTKSKRGSLQAIFVPSFLQASATEGSVSPPLSPSQLSPTSASRMGSLSNTTPSTSSSSSTITQSAYAPAETHYRKRSTTFSASSSQSGFNYIPSPSRTSPPPDFLLDDDPFANLTAAPSQCLGISSSGISSSRTSIDASNSSTLSSSAVPPLPPLYPIPRSPLHETPPLPALVGKVGVPSSASAPSSPPASPRVLPSGRSQPRPAYQRPAFSSRPSLPSLDTLARMNVVLTKKPRKGRVGAGLPFEPWDNLPPDPASLTISPSPPSAIQTTAPIPIPSNPSSFTSSPSSSAVSTPTNSTPINAHIPHSTLLAVSGTETISTSASATPTMSAPIEDLHCTTNNPSTPIAKPRTLLPSEILAIGSLAEDIQLIPISESLPPPSRPRSSSSPYDLCIESPTTTSSDRPCSSLEPVSLTLSSPLSATEVSFPSSPPVIPVVDLVNESEAILSISPTSPISFAPSPDVDLVLEDPTYQPLCLPSTVVSTLSSDHTFVPSSSSSPPKQWLGRPVNTGGDFTNNLQKVLDEVHEVHSRQGSFEIQEGSGNGHLGKLMGNHRWPSIPESEDGDRHGAYGVSGSRVTSGSLQGRNEITIVQDHSDAMEGTGTAVTVARSPVSPGETLDDRNAQHLMSSKSSMIFSSTLYTSNSASHSLFSLSRSVSSTSYSSIESISSTEAEERAALTSADEDYGIECYEEDGVFDFDQSDRLGGWQYRESSDLTQSLSSLELDMDDGQHLELVVDRDVRLRQRERGSSTRSSSSHPSLSRTRSFSDESEVLHSPMPEDYLYFPYADVRARTMMGSAVEAGQTNDVVYNNAMDGAVEPKSLTNVLSAPTHHDDQVNLSLVTAFSGACNDELGYGFNVNQEKLMMAEEETLFENGKDDDDGRDGKEEKNNLAMDTRLANTSRVTTTNFDTSGNTHFSPTSNDIQRASSFTATTTISSVTLSPREHPTAIPLPSPSASEFAFYAAASPQRELQSGEIMPMPTRANSMTFSSITGRTNAHTSTRHRTSVDSSHGELLDSSGRDGHRSGYYSSLSHRPQTGQSSSVSHSLPLSKGHNRGRLQRHGGDSEDEDENEDERRRRKALERLHAAAAMESDEEDESDSYGRSDALSSKNSLASPWNAHAGSGSHSPSTSASFATASSRSPSTQPMNFPTSSGQSSRYVSEDERNGGGRVSDDDDDDVPLAQRIPGALTAQKSIRRQFRREREQRKMEKMLRLEEERARQTTLRPAAAGASGSVSPGGDYASSREAAMLATAATNVQTQQRQRSQTLSSTTPSTPVNPYDLARKLQNVQLADAPPAYQQQLTRNTAHIRNKSISKDSGDHQHLASPINLPSSATVSSAVRSRSIRGPSSHFQNNPSVTPISASPLPGLRPMRSFHRPDRHQSAIEENHPADSENRLTRSTTKASRTSYETRRSPSLSRGAERLVRPEEPMPPLPINLNTRPSMDDQSRKLPKMQGSPEARLQASRVSGEQDRHSRTTGVSQYPPLPINKPVITQQRIFIVNLQQFHMVELTPSSTSGDVIALLDVQGILKGWAGEGGWMMFEVAQDFGMERPIRSYELLSDVQASWIKDKTVNYFVVRLTPFAVPLRRSNIPSSSPTYAGYVEYEVKRGKWSKRWLELREHSLWISKREGKDEICLCSLSNFDAYQITRAHRAPKPFPFAVKSTDNLSFFEDTADYLHTFSASEKDGKMWMEKILVARSYVLYQERNVLFNPKSTTTTPSGNATGALSRSGTKKYANKPIHPLLSSKQDIFEPGSLLAKHS